MKLIFLITILFFYSFNVTADEGYVIIDAVRLPDSAKQPTWIAVSSAGKVEHVSTGQSIVRLPVGIYKIEHFDYGESYVGGAGTLHVTQGARRKKIGRMVDLS